MPNPAIRDLLLTNARSAVLREVSLGIITRVDALLHDSDIVHDQNKQVQLYAELEAQGGRLVELGIESNMHVGTPHHVFLSQPVLMAEYIAGQCCKLAGSPVVAEHDILPTIQEMGESHAGSLHVIEGKNNTPRLGTFLAVQAMVNSLYGCLGASSEERWQSEGSPHA
jgi:hypothetical protein